MDIKSYQASKNYTDKEVKTVDDRITQEIDDLYGAESLNPPNLLWEQGSIQNISGTNVNSNSRIRSAYKEVESSTQIRFSISRGYEFWIVEYDSNHAIITEVVTYSKGTVFTTSNETYYIKIVIRRTGVPTNSVDSEEFIKPEDIHDTDIRIYVKPDHNMQTVSKASDELQKINNYTNIDNTGDLIELDVYSNRNFYVEISDLGNKILMFKNLHRIKDKLISRVLTLNALSVSNIIFPSNIRWQNDNLPLFVEGRTYLILFQSFDGGISWLGSVTSSWENRRYVVYDDFERENQLGLGTAPTGQTWEYSPTSVWEIREGSARVHTFRTDGDILSSDMAFCESGLSDVRVSSVVEERSSERIRLMVRVSDIHNYILAGRVSDGGFAVFKMENGVQTQLSSYGFPSRPFANGDTLSVELDGPNIKVYHNGHVIISISTSFNEQATKHGILSLSKKDNIFHNFSVEGL